MAFEATLEGYCQACRGTIYPRDMIRRGTIGWVHDGCREPELPPRPSEDAAAAAWADQDDAQPF